MILWYDFSIININLTYFISALYSLSRKDWAILPIILFLAACDFILNLYFKSPMFSFRDRYYIFIIVFIYIRFYLYDRIDEYQEWIFLYYNIRFIFKGYFLFSARILCNHNIHCSPSLYPLRPLLICYN